MFDVANYESFENAQNWIDSINQHAEENIAKVIFGNVNSEENRKVSRDDA